jgi:hypothetical protein
MVNNEDPNNFANQFIGLWQENFAKMVSDPEIMTNSAKFMGFMQQFYDKSSSATSATSHGFSNDQLFGHNLAGRIAELEARVAKLESKPSAKRRERKTT